MVDCYQPAAMKTLPEFPPTAKLESREQRFRVVAPSPEPEPFVPAIDPPTIFIDYNSQPRVSRGFFLDRIDRFSLSFRGAAALAVLVCLLTILACFFLLPRV